MNHLEVSHKEHPVNKGAALRLRVDLTHDGVHGKLGAEAPLPRIRDASHQGVAEHFSILVGALSSGNKALFNRCFQQLGKGRQEQR